MRGREGEKLWRMMREGGEEEEEGKEDEKEKEPHLAPGHGEAAPVLGEWLEHLGRLRRRRRWRLGGNGCKNKSLLKEIINNENFLQQIV